MTHKRLLGSDTSRGRIGDTDRKPRFLSYVVTCGALVAMWGFFGGSMLSLAVILMLWAIAVAIDLWNTYRRQPSDEEVRREMDRMNRHAGPRAPGSTTT